MECQTPQAVPLPQCACLSNSSVGKAAIFQVGHSASDKGCCCWKDTRSKGASPKPQVTLGENKPLLLMSCLSLECVALHGALSQLCSDRQLSSPTVTEAFCVGDSPLVITSQLFTECKAETWSGIKADSSRPSRFPKDLFLQKLVAFTAIMQGTKFSPAH